MLRRPTARVVGPLLVGVLLTLALPAWSAESPATRPAAEPPNPPREQTVYIPYEQLRAVFEQEGRGVFLPYEQFRRLWDAARAAEQAPPQVGPPVGVLITEILSAATVQADVVRVRATLRIELLQRGWHQVPLRLHDAAITAATIEEAPARIVSDDQGGSYLLIEHDEDTTREIELVLEFAKAFNKSPGRNSVSFAAPQAPVSRWKVTVPQAGVTVNVYPLLAATEVPAATETDTPEHTEVLAFVGAAPEVRIDWTPRAEGAMGLKPLVSVRTTQELWIGEGVVRTRTQLAYDISRAALAQLVLRVPAEQKVVNVYDANVRQWSVTGDEDGQQITVELFEPARNAQGLLVELEQFAAEGQQMRTVAAPVVAALDVNRQQGVILVSVADGLLAEPVARSGLLQVDAAEVPRMNAPPGGTRPALAYRYVTLPFTLRLRVDKVQPRITADTLVEALLGPGQLTLNLNSILQIERAGVFQLVVQVPPDFRIGRVTGLDRPGITGVQVADHHRNPDDPNHLFIDLQRQALGPVGLQVQVYRQLREPALLEPTGEQLTLPIPVPRVGGAAVERETGHLVVYVTESLRINPVDVVGLRSVGPAEARAGKLTQFNHEDMEKIGFTTMAFAFGESAASLKVVAERRKPLIHVRQLLAVRVEPGVVKYHATFDYDVRYSAVPRLRVDIPAEIAPRIQVETPNVRESIIKDADPPPPDGYVAWALHGEAVLKGRVQIDLAWERELGKLDVGQPITIDVPHLRPAGADRTWGQVALAKSEGIDIRAIGRDGEARPTGLRPIDPQHDLHSGGGTLRSGGVARAFEFYDAWQLAVSATRYQLEQVKHTSVERALLRMVVTRSERLAVQALYRMRSAQQRLALQLPAGVEFDADPLRIDGQPVALERGQEDTFFVPLVGRDPETPFVLEVRYSLPDCGLALSGPVFPADPAVQKVYLVAYLPEDWALLGWRGPWGDELRWDWDDLTGYSAAPRRSDGSLASWVTEGVAVSGDPVQRFPTDGRPYLFSTLRPPPPPAGTLALITVDQTLLQVLAVGAVVLAGLLLLRAGSRTRLVVVGAAATALILAAVFLPTFVRQVLDGATISAGAVVLILWLVQYFGWTRPQRRREAPAEPLPPAAPAESPEPPEPPPAQASSDAQAKPAEGDDHA